MSIVYSAVWIGRKVLRLFKTSFSDGFIVSLITGCIVVELFSLIPIVEWFLKIFLVVTAVGAIWQVTWAAIKASKEDAVDATSQ